MLVGVEAHARLWCSCGALPEPSKRAGHSMAQLRAGGGRPALVVHGGRTKDSKLCKDTWVLELAS